MSLQIGPDPIPGSPTWHLGTEGDHGLLEQSNPSKVVGWCEHDRSTPFSP
jgi:hypothetical protein